MSMAHDTVSVVWRDVTIMCDGVREAFRGGNECGAVGKGIIWWAVIVGVRQRPEG